MALILDIRGVNGSGKSHLVREFIYGGTVPPMPISASPYDIPRLAENTKEVIGVAILEGGTGGVPVVALGRYDKPSGGCDATKRQEQIRERVREFIKEGFKIIVFEGVITSTIFGAYAPFAMELIDRGHTYVVCYLDTPLDICRANIAARRTTSKVDRKPFNDALFLRKARSIFQTRPKFEAVGVPTLTLPYGFKLRQQQIVQSALYGEEKVPVGYP